MALPTKSQITGMDYLDWSLPSFFVDVDSSGGGGGSDVSNNVWVNVSGTWKNVTDDIIYVKVGGSWKNLSTGGGGGSIDSSTMDYLGWSLPVVGKS